MGDIDLIGKIALGSRLRILSSKITEDAGKLYKHYEVNLLPKWFPVFFVLSKKPQQTITEIALDIRHSQPSVSKIIREMTKAGIVIEKKDKSDKRKNVISLSKKGKTLIDKIQIQYHDVDKAIERLIEESTHNLWEAVTEWEFLMEQESLFKRVIAEKKKRESLQVQITQYNEKDQLLFKELNIDWISRYFEMEDVDFQMLDDPQKNILEKGGEILVAKYNGKAVGVCALIKMDDPVYDYELAKMAVSSEYQGKNIGYLLGKQAIQTAKKLGATKIYLESNTILKPAINLYYKLGFKKISGHNSPYNRCNIQMELKL